METITNIVDKAALFAMVVHDGHENQHDGEPYICHLYRVATSAMRAGDSDDIIAACWLHDAIEDGRCSYSDIVRHVSISVADIVLALTKIKGETNESYYLNLRSRPDAARAKTHDLKDNFRRNHLIEDDEKRLRMAKKYSLGQDILRDYM